MSFQIKDKKKIALFRKCVQILTHEKEDFCMHFSRTHIRVFNENKDDSQYMVDFQEQWFSKFFAPEILNNSEEENPMIQIRMNRDVFLQSFNLIDDIELEFLVSFDEDMQFGLLKVIKTRDLYIIEANVRFEVDREICCDTDYTFPETDMLINSNLKHMKNIKGIFKKDAKNEVMELVFLQEQLEFRGEINSKFGYEIKTSQLEGYGNYLHGSFELADKFKINMGLKHLLSLIKICDLIDNNFMTAMEQVNQNSAVAFLTTHSAQRDFNFLIALGNVLFQQLDDSSFIGSISQQNRLRQQMFTQQAASTKGQVNVQMERQQMMMRTAGSGNASQGIAINQELRMTTDTNALMVKSTAIGDKQSPIFDKTNCETARFDTTTVMNPGEHVSNLGPAINQGSIRRQAVSTQERNLEVQDQKEKQDFYNQVDGEVFF